MPARLEISLRSMRPAEAHTVSTTTNGLRWPEARTYVDVVEADCSSELINGAVRSVEMMAHAGRTPRMAAGGSSCLP